MPSSLMHKVDNLLIGIRFSRSFRIPEISGEIVDELLYGEKTPFGPSLFPGVRDYSDEKVLFNKDTEDFFRINSDDIILNTTVKNIDKEFNELIDKKIPFIIENVILKYKIKNIFRLGMVFNHKLANSEILDELVNNFTVNTIQEPNNVSLSFAKKHTSQEADFNNVQDYINTIMTFEKNSEGMAAVLDYQKYFIPPREDIRDTKVDSFINEARRYAVNEFHPLLRKYYEA